MKRRSQSVASTRRLGCAAAMVAGLLLPGSAFAAPSVTPASKTVVVDAQGSSGFTLLLPRPATVDVDTGVRVDLLDQPAAFVQLVPSRCRTPEPGNWCPEHALLAIDDIELAPGENFTSFSTSNSPNILAGPMDVYVLAAGPVRVSITLQGLPDGVTRIVPDRQVDGVLRKIESTCAPEFGDCRTVAEGYGIEDVGKRGSTIIHAYSRTRDQLSEQAGTGTSDFAASKGNVACGYSQDLGSSIDPSDHDGSCDATPRTSSDEWRQNAVNYVGRAQPVMGPTNGFSSYGANQTGRVYKGFRAHALSAHDQAVEPGSAFTGAWAAWLRAGLR